MANHNFRIHPYVYDEDFLNFSVGNLPNNSRQPSPAQHQEHPQHNTYPASHKRHEHSSACLPWCFPNAPPPEYYRPETSAPQPVPAASRYAYAQPDPRLRLSRAHSQLILPAHTPARPLPPAEPQAQADVRTLIDRGLDARGTAFRAEMRAFITEIINTQLRTALTSFQHDLQDLVDSTILERVGEAVQEYMDLHLRDDARRQIENEMREAAGTWLNRFVDEMRGEFRECRRRERLLQRHVDVLASAQNQAGRRARAVSERVPLEEDDVQLRG